MNKFVATMLKKMAMPAQNVTVPIPQIQKTGGSQTVSQLNEYWFSALRPIAPQAPPSYRPRKWPFVPGWNQIWSPRDEEGNRVPYEILYRCAEEWDLFSSAMETVIDKITSLDWQVRKKTNSKTAEAKIQAQDDPIATKITTFLQKPCRIAGCDTTRGFLNALLTDMYIGDCATIWIEKNILGQVISLSPVYGPTIKCLLDDTGRRPSDINPDKTVNPQGKKDAAFQQVNYGLPVADFILNEVCEIANCVPVWNGQSLDFYPLSEVSQAGGGVVYTPRTASGPVVVLDSNYFEMEKDEAPVTVKQENMQSVCNILDINYSDAAFDSNGMCGYQAYQSTSVRISDAEHCGLYGPMNGSPRGYDDYICDATTATKVGWPVMKRQRFADTYAVDFKLPQTVGSLLDPMDLITVNDPLFGGILTTGVATTGPAGQDVRISELSEDKDGVWTLSCERFMYGMSAPQAPSTAGTVSNPPPSVSAPAGDVNTPYFFEPTAALAVALGMTSEGGLAIAVSASATNYGGCVVNVSTDGGSSYNPIGRLPGNSTMGYTTADYPVSPNPDASDTLSVDLTESEGDLMSYTSGQQAQLIPIALVDNGGTIASGSAAGYTTEIPYEIVAYETVSLVSTYNYDLLPTILRGQLGTVPADHPYGGSPVEGSVFVDLSNPNSVFKTSVPSGNIVGNTLYFKFQTFNQYGAAIQDISDCTAYSFALTGATNPTSPTSPGGSYTLTPSPLLYQGKAGGWPGVDGSSTSWTNPDNVYWPSFTANFASGAVDYAANDSGTSAFTGSGQTVFVTIYDPSRSGSGTVHVDSTNANATTPGYVYLGTITSITGGTSGSTGGSSGTGGPQDVGTVGSYAIFVNGTPIQ